MGAALFASWPELRRIDRREPRTRCGQEKALEFHLKRHDGDALSGCYQGMTPEFSIGASEKMSSWLKLMWSSATSTTTPQVGGADTYI